MCWAYYINVKWQKNSNCIVITHNLKHSEFLKQQGVKHCQTINSPFFLQGQNLPILIDNATMHIILEETINKIDELTNKLRKYEQ